MNRKPVARYSFLPWLRQGIASKINEIDNLGVGQTGQGERASVKISLEIKASKEGCSDVIESITKSLELYGPGDITGIDPRAVVRTDPKDWVTDFETNYFPLIEFYDEDFPWRFTPARATEDERLRPWICLIVLAEDEFDPVHLDPKELSGDASLKLFSIKVKKVGESLPLPKPTETWAWAHVHVNRPLQANNGNDITEAMKTILEENPDLAISRLVCPRKLKPNTAYHAFVVPTFEAGRLAGLGLETEGEDGLKPAWNLQQNEVELPVYYRWYFRTGERGDFEYLVRLIQPRILDKRVGIRDMDVTSPGWTTEPAALGLEGALMTLQTESTEWTNKATFQSQLSDLVNLSETLQESGNTKTPVVTPPLYGRWHAQVKKLRAQNNPLWIEQLNLDPRNRVAAGFGTQVIQTLQEDLMKAAWEQVGSILEANSILKRAQFCREVNRRLFEKNIKPLELDPLVSLTSPVHSRILNTSGPGAVTVKAEMKQSRLPAASVSRAFRRITRPRGPFTLRIDHQWNIRLHPIIRKLNEQTITAAPPKKSPTEQLSLPANESILTPRLIEQTPQRPEFGITKPGDPFSGAGGHGADSAVAKNFRAAAIDANKIFQKRPQVATPRQFNLTNVKNRLLDILEPGNSIPRRVCQFVAIPACSTIPRPDPIAPVMAAPDFPRPMYEPLRDISPELLIPNLNLIPQNTIALLKTNQRFVEAYLVGLNHEIGRELLWREYPTDQRGSYFRQFWDVSDFVNRKTDLPEKELAEKLRDIKPIHKWSREANLGENDNRHFAENEEYLVLAIRSDLLKKYPNAVIFAVKARWPEKGGSRTLGEEEKYPVFRAKIDPDITFFGFDLTADEVKGTDNPQDKNPGWFFVIKERPGEPRFGLDLADGPAEEIATNWDALSWGHLAATPENFEALNYIELTTGQNPNQLKPLYKVDIGDDLWGKQAAAMAYITYQDPVYIAVHASEMLLDL